MTYIGVDYGDSRTGVSVSPDGICAVPLTVIDSSSGRKKTAAMLADIVLSKKAGCVVIGYPLNMDGSKGKRVIVTEKFANALKEALGEAADDIRIVFQDERLTSKAAESRMRTAGINSGIKGISDQLAAVMILQDYIDSLNRKD